MPAIHNPKAPRHHGNMANTGTLGTSKTREQLTRKSRWQTKREQERNRARYLIKERIASEAQEGQSVHDGVALDHNDDEHESALTSNEEFESIQRKYIDAIESGSVSTFSLRNLESHRNAITRPVPIAMLDRTRMKEISMSRFGEKHKNTVLAYVSGVGTMRMVDYASILGEYDIVKSIIVGGYNPVCSTINNIDNDKEATVKGRKDQITRMVFKRLHIEKLPLTLSAYVVKSVAEMRMWGWNSQLNSAISDGTEICGICKSRCDRLLGFGRQCMHSFCELCIWEVIMKHIDERQNDVVQCPICEVSYSRGDVLLNCIEDDNSSEFQESVSPLDRCKASLERYKRLPEDAGALRALRKEHKMSRRKIKRNTVHCNIYSAILPTLGSSKEVRRDRFLRYVEGGDSLFVLCCLEAGVDVNLRNEYGQTAFYLGCWKGHEDIAKLLLGWGADPRLKANGNMSSYHAALSNGADAVAKMISDSTDSLSLEDYLCLNDATSNCGASEMRLLIDFHCNHEGAGAFIIDNVLSEEFFLKLDSLFRSLPVDNSDKVKKQKKGRPCSKRSYFCDAEGSLCTALAAVVAAALDDSTTKMSTPADVYFFPQMRFLNYDEPTSWLAPHTDLAKTELSGKKSTHTFILYLSDCEEGGETALLADVVSCEILAKVSPRRGRLFLFPHACLHEGMEVVTTPKLLLRGEVLLNVDVM